MSKYKRRKTTDEMAKDFGDKDYHSEKLLSGKVGSGKYNVAVSGKKGNERYSKSLTKDGKKQTRTVTSTRKSNKKGSSEKSTYTSFVSQTESKDGKSHHIKGHQTHKRKRNLKIRKKKD